jgi:hypothetical protein
MQNKEKNHIRTMLKFIQVKRNESISQQGLKEFTHDNKIECTKQGLGRSKSCGLVFRQVNAAETPNPSRLSRVECLSVVCVSVCECVCVSGNFLTPQFVINEEY